MRKGVKKNTKGERERERVQSNRANISLSADIVTMVTNSGGIKIVLRFKHSPLSVRINDIDIRR